MSKPLNYLALLILTAGPGAASAADEGRGRLLYENHCQACHTSMAHVRSNRLATTPEALRAQIVRWQDHLELGWNAEEINAVFNYLSAAYYKF